MFHPGQPVIYQGELFYVVGTPLIGAGGLRYTISSVPPPIQGVREQELIAVPAVESTV
jgi:hypothetical protein